MIFLRILPNKLNALRFFVTYWSCEHCSTFIIFDFINARWQHFATTRYEKSHRGFSNFQHNII